jgi:ketosteroid isomerase-like protein
MNKTAITCFVLMLLPLMFLGRGVDQEKMLSKEDENAIRNLQDAFENRFLDSDWTSTMIEFYADNAVQLPPNESALAGRESIQARFDSFKGNLSWENRERPIMIIEGRDDLAFTWSHFKGKGKRNGESFKNGAMILTIFRKQQDGTWKIICDCWSYDK